MEENFSMEWNMEENFSMEWNMGWKIFGMEWKWNGRKLPVWNMEKSSSIPFHTMPCATATCTRFESKDYKNKTMVGRVLAYSEPS